MTRNRLEAFSDGVIAILITIMVLELRPPHGTRLEDLLPLLPKVLSYLLSFVFVAIYWNNLHHMLHTLHRVIGRVLWANMHLLFWLSLVPFVTGWMGENHFAALPTSLYGMVLFMAAAAYFILQHCIISVSGGKDALLAKAVGNDRKGKASLLMYAIAIPAAFWNQWLSDALYVAVAVMWLIPDKRIERAIAE